MNKLHLLISLLSAAAFAHAKEAATLVELFNEARSAGRYEQAIGHAEAALRLAVSFDAWLCLGRAQGGLGRHEVAQEALVEAERLANDVLQLVITNTLLGDQYAVIGNHALARSHYERSLEMARQANNRRFQAINRNRLGSMLMATSDPSAALAQYRLGLELAGNDNERAESHAYIAAAYATLGEYNLAIEHQIKAVLLQERMGSLGEYAEANLALARICLAGQAYRDAERWLAKFIPVMRLNEAVYWEAHARALMARVQAALGNTEAAATERAQARILAEKAGDQELLRQLEEKDGRPGAR